MFQSKLIILAVVSVVFGFVSNVFAQIIEPPGVEWERTYPADNKVLNSIIELSDGSYILVGFSYYIQNDIAIKNSYILRLDSAGNKIWEKSYAPGGLNSCVEVKGNIIATGEVVVEIIGHFFYTDVYLLKINLDGDIIWEKNFGDSPFDSGRTIQKTKDNGLIICGSTESAGGRLYVLKINSSEEKAWGKKFPADYDVCVKETNDGNFILLANNIPGFITLFKIDNLGNQIWFKYLGHLGPNEAPYWGGDLEVTLDGGFMVLGDFTDFYPLPRGTIIAHFLKTDSNGKELWKKSIEPWTHGSFNNYFFQKIRDEGFVMAIGPCIRINSKGDIIWRKYWEKDFYTRAHSVKVTKDGGYIILGTTTPDMKDYYFYIVKFLNDSFLDCNNNGIDDTKDIASGVSKDCNTNQIPDECDIASGASKDTNRNNIPDECEPKKYPVIIIPGAMGSELKDVEDDSVLWPRIGGLSIDDPWLAKLLLQQNGVNTDDSLRCAYALDMIVTSFIQCPFPQLTVSGREAKATDVTRIAGFYHAYDDLIAFLSQEASGYTKNENLFALPYDWRLDLQTSAEKLKKEIDEICSSTGTSKVNIIAHSLGGLVARTYIQQHIDDHRLDTVIFLGTPHRGSPISYATLEGYKPLLGLLREIWPFDQNWWLELDTQTFVCQNFPTMYQALPRYGYIEKGGVLEDYTTSNESLRNNNGQLLDRAIEFFGLIEKPYPQDIKYYSILGTALPTLNGFVFRGNQCKGVSIDFWADGKVPNTSSTWFGLDKKYFAKAEHASLPGDSAVQEKILNLLKSDPDTPVTGIYDRPQKYEDENGVWKKFKKLTSCCPISLKISNTEGKIIGVDSDGIIKEQIPNSEYFKFEENEAGYFPDGEYVIEIKGKGSGEFTLILETLEDNNVVTNVVEYTNIPVVEQSKGIILLSEEDPSPELYYDVDGDNTDDFILNPGEEPPEDLKSMFAQKGDINHDNSVDISDGINILKYLFLGEKASCPEAGEVNSDNAMDVSDAIYLLSYLFLGTQKKPEGLVLCK